jgi:hypothetical protein
MCGNVANQSSISWTERSARTDGYLRWCPIRCRHRCPPRVRFALNNGHLPPSVRLMLRLLRCALRAVQPCSFTGARCESWLYRTPCEMVYPVGWWYVDYADGRLGVAPYQLLDRILQPDGLSPTFERHPSLQPGSKTIRWYPQTKLEMWVHHPQG